MPTANGSAAWSDAGSAARAYLGRGYAPVPVPHRKKYAVRPGWPELRIRETDVDAYFPPAVASNLGLLLGDASGGLIDVDLDSPETRASAPFLLPPTDMVGGRSSAPRSHWWYVAADGAPAKASQEYVDPVRRAEAVPGQDDAALLLELRSTGGQTIAPPSLYPADEKKGHPTDEPCVWFRDHLGDPARLPAADIRAAVGAVAAAALLGRYWRKSRRHACALSLAGGLLRRWPVERVEAFVRAVCAAARDEEADKRVKDVHDTAERLQAGEPVTGFPNLIKELGKDGPAIMGAVGEWLELPRGGLSGPDVTFGGNSGNCVQTWPDPLPLSTPPLTPPYPLEVLPDWLGEWADAVATELQVPVDMPAAVGLGLVGGGIARKVAVRPRPGFTEPTNQYVMCALPPGERKTQTVKKGLAPVLELERELVEAAAPVIQAQESEFRIAEKRVKNLEEKIAKPDVQNKPTLVEELKTARAELLAIAVPARPLLYSEDDTPESLKKELVLQGGRLMVASTEAKCLENITLYSDRPNFDVYLKAHAGDEIKSGRIGRGRDSVTEPALTCILAPQPEVLRGLAENDVLRGRGFLARWYYSLPRSNVGARRVGAPAVPDAVQGHYHALVKRAWQIGYAEGEADAARPHVLGFDAAARAEFEAFENWLESQLAPGRPLARLAGWANKLNGACARLAAALHVADALGGGGDWTGPIGAGAVGRAVRLCREYYIPHAVAAFDLMGTNPVVGGAWKVWAWVRAEGLATFTKRDAFRACRASFETVDDMQPALDLLERHYLIRQQAGPTRSGPGRPSSPVYDVNPAGGDGEGAQAAGPAPDGHEFVYEEVL